MVHFRSIRGRETKEGKILTQEKEIPGISLSHSYVHKSIEAFGGEGGTYLSKLLFFFIFILIFIFLVYCVS